MKDSGIEWIGEIPDDWCVRKVKTVAKYHKDIAGAKSEDIQRLALTMNGVVKRSKTDASGLQPDNFDTYQILNEGDLVFKLIDLANIATSRVGLSPWTGIVSPAYIVLTPIDIDAKFAEYFFFSMYYLHIFNMLGSEGVRSSLGKDDVLNFPIIAPPFDVQRRIADYLDAKTAIIDEKIAAAKSQIEHLKEYRSALIHDVVCHGIPGMHDNMYYENSGVEWIGNVPREWEITKGKFLFTERSTKGNKELILLSPTQRYGVVPQSQLESAVRVKDDSVLPTFKTVHKGDFIISLRSFQGGFEYSELEGVCSPAYHTFVPIVDIDDNYYRYLFKMNMFIQEIASHCMSLRDGQNIPFEWVANTYLPVPPFDDQQVIAEYLSNKTMKIDSTISDMKSLIEHLEAYRAALIYEVVTGKKEV